MTRLVVVSIANLFFPNVCSVMTTVVHLKFPNCLQVTLSWVSQCLCGMERFIVWFRTIVSLGQSSMTKQPPSSLFPYVLDKPFQPCVCSRLKDVCEIPLDTPISRMFLTTQNVGHYESWRLPKAPRNEEWETGFPWLQFQTQAGKSYEQDDEVRAPREEDPRILNWWSFFQVHLFPIEALVYRYLNVSKRSGFSLGIEMFLERMRVFFGSYFQCASWDNKAFLLPAWCSWKYCPVRRDRVEWSSRSLQNDYIHWIWILIDIPHGRPSAPLFMQMLDAFTQEKTLSSQVSSSSFSLDAPFRSLLQSAKFPSVHVMIVILSSFRNKSKTGLGDSNDSGSTAITTYRSFKTW
jgi:hypothetical protein